MKLSTIRQNRSSRTRVSALAIATLLISNTATATVFTVSLPSATVTTTGSINPPPSATNETYAVSHFTETTEPVCRAISFNNNAQLSLALNASRETRLPVSGTSQGSQAASAAANGVNPSVPAKGEPMPPAGEPDAPPVPCCVLPTSLGPWVEAAKANPEGFNATVDAFGALLMEFEPDAYGPDDVCDMFIAFLVGTLRSGQGE